MLRILLSYTPFLVCLCWFVVFALTYRRNDTAKRSLTWFLATCVILYLCHALYFTTGLPHLMECLWTLCSLSVYPLYYAYICKLTLRPLSNKRLALILLPGLLVALAKYFFPEEGDTARKLLNALQIVPVCYYGFRHLHAFDKQLSEVYADTEGRDTRAIKRLLIAFVFTSVYSAIANALGKHFFAQSLWLIALILTPITVLLCVLSYIGYRRSYSVEQFMHDNAIDSLPTTTGKHVEIGKELEQLMHERQFYLRRNLKIGDIAIETGICRTYISAYVNNVIGCTFSEFINRFRVEHAKRLMLERKGTKLSVVAQLSGFSSEQSFYRNFYLFTQMKPSEWLAAELRQQAS